MKYRGEYMKIQAKIARSSHYVAIRQLHNTVSARSKTQIAFYLL